MKPFLKLLDVSVFCGLLNMAVQEVDVLFIGFQLVHVWTFLNSISKLIHLFKFSLIIVKSLQLVKDWVHDLILRKHILVLHLLKLNDIVIIHLISTQLRTRFEPSRNRQTRFCWFLSYTVIFGRSGTVQFFLKLFKQRILAVHRVVLRHIFMN